MRRYPWPHSWRQPRLPVDWIIPGEVSWSMPDGESVSHYAFPVPWNILRWLIGGRLTGSLLAAFRKHVLRLEPLFWMRGCETPNREPRDLPDWRATLPRCEFCQTQRVSGLGPRHCHSWACMCKTVTFGTRHPNPYPHQSRCARCGAYCPTVHDARTRRCLCVTCSRLFAPDAHRFRWGRLLTGIPHPAS